MGNLLRVIQLDTVTMFVLWRNLILQCMHAQISDRLLKCYVLVIKNSVIKGTNNFKLNSPVFTPKYGYSVVYLYVFNEQSVNLEYIVRLGLHFYYKLIQT